MRTEFAIIGGGIAGLSMAIALKKIGIDALVFEAADQINPVGAGITLAANAIQAYRKLGIADEVIKAGRPLQQLNIYDEKGRLISRADSVRLQEKFGVNNYAIHRSDLHNVLLSHIPADKLFTGKRSAGLKHIKEGYEVLFHDGSFVQARYLIVAEGIHSTIRKQLLPESRTRYSGYTCWRGVSDNSEPGISETSETWGRNGRFGIVPLKNNQVYWYACVNAPENSDKYRRYSVADLQRQFRSYHQPIGDLLCSAKNSNLIWSDIIDLNPISQYAFENLLLVGDAAHATTPNMGQGACQAIEDAAVLQTELRNNSNIAHAFKNFEAKRLKRTHQIVNQSWTLGRLAQSENRLLIGIRNGLMRMMPASVQSKQLEKIYDVSFL